MKTDAHYYAILAFCRACGFKKDNARTIAYASEYVDHADINLVFFEDAAITIEHDIVEKQPAFINMSTCQSYFNIETFSYEAMINNTCAFHFVPGCEGKSFMRKLQCKEASPVILQLLNEALSDDNLIKLGIILHAYADSFSHQGFSGMLSKVNHIRNCTAMTKVYVGFAERILKVLKRLTGNNYDNYFDHIVPAYGHSQALDFPDLPYLKWSYEFDGSDDYDGSYQHFEIDNRERYRKAFINIKKILDSYLEKHPEYLDPTLKFKNFDALTRTLILADHDQKRVYHWKRTMIDQNLFNRDDLSALIYENDTWLKEAFANYDPNVFNNLEVKNAQLADNFSKSNWYQFYLSVKWYKKRFFECCRKFNLYIPQ